MNSLINRIAEYAYHTNSLDGYTMQEAEGQTRETLKTDPAAVLRFLQDAAADGDTEAAELLAGLKIALKHAHNRKKEEIKMKNYNLHRETFRGLESWTWGAEGTVYHAPIHDGGLWKEAPDGVCVDPDGSKHTAYTPKQIQGTCQYSACETYSGMLRKIKRESEYAEYNRFISKH